MCFCFFFIECLIILKYTPRVVIVVRGVLCLSKGYVNVTVTAFDFICSLIPAATAATICRLYQSLQHFVLMFPGDRLSIVSTLLSVWVVYQAVYDGSSHLQSVVICQSFRHKKCYWLSATITTTTTIITISNSNRQSVRYISILSIIQVFSMLLICIKPHLILTLYSKCFKQYCHIVVVSV